MRETTEMKDAKEAESSRLRRSTLMRRKIKQTSPWVMAAADHLLTVDRGNEKLMRRVLCQYVPTLSLFGTLDSASHWTGCFFQSARRRGDHISADIYSATTYAAVEATILLLGTHTPSGSCDPGRFAEVVRRLCSTDERGVTALNLQSLVARMAQLTENYATSRAELGLRNTCGALAMLTSVVVCGMWSGVHMMWTTSANQKGTIADLRQSFTALDLKAVTGGKSGTALIRVPPVDVTDMLQTVAEEMQTMQLLNGQIQIEAMRRDSRRQKERAGTPETHSLLVATLITQARHVWSLTLKPCSIVPLFTLNSGERFNNLHRISSTLCKTVVACADDDLHRSTMACSTTIRDIYGDLIFGTPAAFTQVIECKITPRRCDSMGLSPLVGWIACAISDGTGSVTQEVSRTCAAIYVLRKYRNIDLEMINDTVAPWAINPIIHFHNIRAALKSRLAGGLAAQLAYLVTCCQLVTEYKKRHNDCVSLTIDLLQLQPPQQSQIGHLTDYAALFEELCLVTSETATTTETADFETRLSACKRMELHTATAMVNSVMTAKRTQ